MKKKDTFQNKKGFILVELIIGSILAGLLFIAVTTAMKSILVAKQIASRYNFANVSSIFEDMNYTISLAKTVSIETNRLTVERVDGCTVSYVYNPDEKTLEKTISGTCNNEKKIILPNVDSFSVSASGTDTYEIKITTNGETNTITVRKM